MTINFIENFQTRIYQLLVTDHSIREDVDRIYLSTTQDSKYPFILINMIKINDCSKFNQAIYEVEFEVCIFIKDKSTKFLINLADKVIARLQHSNFILERCILAGIKAGKITIERSQDLVTTKLSISYNSLLKEKI